MRKWLWFLGLLAVSSPAYASPDALGVPTDGYVYFHRTGATMEQHNIALRRCTANSLKTLPPLDLGYVAVTNGWVTMSSPHYVALNTHLAANIENCMVATGWEVLQLNADEGARIDALDQRRKEAALSGLVGAVSPEGKLVRSFRKLDILSMRAAMAADKGRQSLSFGAVEPDAGPWVLPTPAAWELVPPAAHGTTPRTAIVVRVTTIAPAQMNFRFTQLDDTAATARPYINVPSPTKLFWKKGAFLEQTYVFPVKPGRWTLGSIGPVGLCLGAPSFDVQQGEVVFAGTFNVGSTDPFQPDMALAPAQQALANADLSERLTPAKYVNGRTFDCGTLAPSFIYSLNEPNAPLASTPK